MNELFNYRLDVYGKTRYGLNGQYISSLFPHLKQCSYPAIGAKSPPVSTSTTPFSGDIVPSHRAEISPSIL